MCMLCRMLWVKTVALFLIAPFSGPQPQTQSSEVRPYCRPFRLSTVVDILLSLKEEDSQYHY